MPDSSVHEAITSVNREFMAAFARKDAAAVASLYTPDAALMPAGEDFIRGRETIAAYWSGAMKLGLDRVTLETVELTGDGSSAQEVGTYDFRGDKGALADRGKYIVLWKREGDQWKIHRAIWTSNDLP